PLRLPVVREHFPASVCIALELIPGLMQRELRDFVDLIAALEQATRGFVSHVVKSKVGNSQYVTCRGKGISDALGFVGEGVPARMWLSLHDRPSFRCVVNRRDDLLSPWGVWRPEPGLSATRGHCRPIRGGKSPLRVWRIGWRTAGCRAWVLSNVDHGRQKTHRAAPIRRESGGARASWTCQSSATHGMRYALPGPLPVLLRRL